MSGSENMSASLVSLAGMIDHTLLKQEAGVGAIEQVCEEAIRWGFATVCVHPCYVGQVARRLAGQASKVCSVVGFPMGMNDRRVKAFEARQAIEDGAEEVDMVIHLAAALAGDLDYVRRDVAAVVEVCHGGGAAVVVKVILETAALPAATKVALCELAGGLGVDFLKTSTGLHAAGGATVEDVRLLYEHRGKCRVKAAGGIRDLATLEAMRRAGAERIGTSSGVAIMEELRARGK